jgi:hypothetical protein
VTYAKKGGSRAPKGSSVQESKGDKDKKKPISKTKVSETDKSAK